MMSVRSHSDSLVEELTDSMVAIGISGCDVSVITISCNEASSVPITTIAISQAFHSHTLVVPEWTSEHSVDFVFKHSDCCTVTLDFLIKLPTTAA